MKRAAVTWGACALVIGCGAHKAASPALDETIAFPSFQGSGADVERIDAPMLSAIELAADDFLPGGLRFLWPASDMERCLYSRKALDYELLRQDELIFVRVTLNPAHCGVKSPVLYGSTQYAIRQGTIVRRLHEGDIEPPPSNADAGPPDGGVP